MAAATETLGRLSPSRSRERIFYTGMSLAILTVVFAGFSRTWFLRPYFQKDRLIPLLIVHGIIFSAWVGLFLVQTTLVATKRTRIHRKLGVAGGVLVVLMIVVGTFTAIVRAKGASPIPGMNPLSFLTIPLGDILVFGILVGAAFYFRNKIDTHKRLMLIATITLLPAAVARLPIGFIETGGPFIFYGLSDLFLLPLVVYDFVTRGKPHRATVLAGALLVISHPLRMVIGVTHAWLVFATWLTHWS